MRSEARRGEADPVARVLEKRGRGGKERERRKRERERRKREGEEEKRGRGGKERERRKRGEEKYQHPGSNWGPSACEADVITNYTMPALDGHYACFSSLILIAYRR